VRSRVGSEETFAVIAGGGTAGHVLPGLAVARALEARGHPASSVHFVGSERGLENQIVPPAGYPLSVLPGRGIERRPSLRSLMAVLSLLVGVLKGTVLIRRLRPHVVMVLGGYASVPCTIGATVWRVPIVVVEQNARAGAASRLAGLVARAAAVPFPDTDLPRRVITGTPVRPEIAGIDRQRDRQSARSRLGLPADRVVVVVFSGSLGSRQINEAVWQALERWAHRRDLAVRHVIGSRDWPLLASRLADHDVAEARGLVYQPVRYEEHMELTLAAADLAVCRAGGTTVAELAQVGLPAILVPLPIAPRDHQTANARALVGAGAAVLVPDAELDAHRLTREVEPLLDDRERLARMSKAAMALARPDAAERVADLVEEHARG
jgi:UDP-N-acetylglucosamine--N-acetylmuramyl-(pentapeptide) pyrophosphoryl-undecaprenol N-acetylglucosamine transferase